MGCRTKGMRRHTAATIEWTKSQNIFVADSIWVICDCDTADDV